MRTASIIDYIPEGKENAITRERLCAVTGLPDRKLREEIEQARRRGEPIVTQAGRAQTTTWERR
jgi:hypothetical protein